MVCLYSEGKQSLPYLEFIVAWGRETAERPFWQQKLVFECVTLLVTMATQTQFVAFVSLGYSLCLLVLA